MKEHLDLYIGETLRGKISKKVFVLDSSLQEAHKKVLRKGLPCTRIATNAEVKEYYALLRKKESELT